MKPTTIMLVCAVALASAIHAAEFHVAVTGDDANRGTKALPLRTIQHAAELAQPGDVITVHAGVYRERINPPRGGTSDRKRIIYQAARGEQVAIKGSEVITNWVRVQADVWKATLPNTFFGRFNPYSDLIRGDWFDRKGRDHHTGAVYLNGDWLIEASKLDDVLKPGGTNASWFGEVDPANTTIWAQFKGVNPNENLGEINVRRTVFYPDQPGRNFITVRGFGLRQAATPWAPPTAEQIGLIGTHWSKGWIIESNTISHSACSGVALGKYGDEWDNRSGNSAEGYIKTVERALTNGWNQATVGGHVVRHNTISDCEQAGIVGSLGCAFSTVSENTIHDIHVRGLFSGAEMAGIKFHGAIDVTIRNNHIYRTVRAIWLDWMAQGTRVSANLCHESASQDLFLEVNHGPFLVDNNLFLSGNSIADWSQGGAFVHNLFAGKIISRPEPRRSTPYHPAHATALAGFSDIKGGDDRFFNNIFIGGGDPTPAGAYAAREPRQKLGAGLGVYDQRELPLLTGGNVYYNGAQPYGKETNFLALAAMEPQVKAVTEGGQFKLQFNFGSGLKQADTALVTSERLGKASVPGLAYQNPDGSPVKIDTDYFGKQRDQKQPTAGPFERPGAGRIQWNISQ